MPRVYEPRLEENYVFGFKLLGKDAGMAGQWLDKIRFYPKGKALKLFPAMAREAN